MCLRGARRCEGNEREEIIGLEVCVMADLG